MESIAKCKPDPIKGLEPYIDLDVAAIERLMYDARDRLLDLLRTSPPRKRQVKNRVGDAITEADYEIQQLLFRKIQTWFPDHGFVGEEENGDGCPTTFPIGPDQNHFIWALDPIDGTQNYQECDLDCAIVVGLLMNNEPIFGAIYILSWSTLIIGGKYWPVMISNDPTIQHSYQSNRSRLGEWDLSSSSLKQKPWRLMYGLGKIKSEEEKNAFLLQLRLLADIERPGSASISIASVMFGRSDGYLSLKEEATKITGWLAILSQFPALKVNIEFASLDLNKPFCFAVTTHKFAAEHLQPGSKLQDCLQNNPSFDCTGFFNKCVVRPAAS